MVATRRGEQSTLYSLRFGMQRAKRGRGRATGSDAADEAKHDAKRPRLSGDEQEEQAALDGHAEGSSGRATSSPAAERQFVKGSGTTTDPSALKPVTHKAFLSKYAVSGLDNVYYNRCWVSGPTAHRWRRELDALLEWYRPKLKVYGREIQQSRAIAAFSTTPGLELKYSGHDVVMHSPFPPLLEAIAARIAQPDCLGEDVKFNHAMLNRYEDGSVHIGKHSDNLENKVIVTVSLGAPRSWIMEEKRPKKPGAATATATATATAAKGARVADAPPRKHRWTLENGSLLVMQGDVQQRYTHEIPKELKIKAPRISITFRQLKY